MRFRIITIKEFADGASSKWRIEAEGKLPDEWKTWVADSYITITKVFKTKPENISIGSVIEL